MMLIWISLTCLWSLSGIRKLKLSSSWATSTIRDLFGCPSWNYGKLMYLNSLNRLKQRASRQRIGWCFQSAIQRARHCFGNSKLSSCNPEFSHVFISSSWGSKDSSVILPPNRGRLNHSINLCWGFGEVLPSSRSLFSCSCPAAISLSSCG